MKVNENKEIGIKYDSEKPDYSLIPPLPLEDIVKVLTFGAAKYSRFNWKLLKNADERYFAAAMRHMWTRWRGEIYDSESGIDHYAHAICCLLFMMQLYRDKTNQ